MTFHALRVSKKRHRLRILPAALIGTILSVILAEQAASTDASETAKKFFEAYQDQKVDEMASLFTEDATFAYVPFGDAGAGNVLKDGVKVWRTLIDAFPDLRNEVNAIWEDKAGDVAFVDVHIGGKQTKDAFGIANKGKEYWLRQMFILETNAEDRITKITSFWDNATWYTQLGKTSLD